MPQVPADHYIGTNARRSPLLDGAKQKCYKHRYTKYCAYGTATPSNKVARAGHKLGVCDYDKLVTNRILHYLTTISSSELFGQSITVISNARAATYHHRVSSQYIRLSYRTCSLYWNCNWTPDSIPKLPKPPTTATDNNHPVAPSYCPPAYYNPPDICRRYPHVENWLTHVRDGRYMLSQQLRPYPQLIHAGTPLSPAGRMINLRLPYQTVVDTRLADQVTSHHSHLPP